ncbi:MAG: hypothetical protein ACPGVO_00080 [Spirulinaceae cyanobacterium]
MVDSTTATMIGGVAIALVGAGLQQFSVTQQSLTTAQTSAARNAIATEISAEALAAADALAKERFNSGQCIKSTIPIVESMKVDRTYAGQIICDAQGTTAVIARNGALTLLAKTGDQAVILEGLK